MTMVIVRLLLGENHRLWGRQVLWELLPQAANHDAEQPDDMIVQNHQG
jgi:hypothetical protein